MDASTCELAAQLVSKAYIEQGSQALAKRRRLVQTLLSQRRLPDAGWDEATIEWFVQEVALMDSNNFLGGIGVGEREARCACPAVARRHYGLTHGIGRSGDVAAEQPKAAGSSLLAKLANLLAADALAAAGLGGLGPVTLLPLATGMALTATLLALRAARPQARYILWPRIDQKTCLKAIVSANLEPVVIPNLLEGEQLRTDVAQVEAELQRLGADSVLCVVTTTSCFAPRGCDRIVELAQLCAKAGVGHVINNAYGVQSAAICKAITSAWRKGRVDAVVQSTDKNFMVPVGGAVVAASRGRPGLVEAVNRAYPGRASMAPLLDVLMTLLHWGRAGWLQALQQREELFPYFQEQLALVSERFGERVLHTPDNPISLAMSLQTLQQPSASSPVQIAPVAAAAAAGGDNTQQPAASACSTARPSTTLLGSMLFKRNVSGVRVIDGHNMQTIAGCKFKGYGAHHDEFPVPYLTVAAALGTSKQDVDGFCRKLAECMLEYKRRVNK